MANDTVTVPKWVARLAATFLREYAERLGNDECDDYDPPEWVPVDELAAMAPDWNNEPEMPQDEARSLCGCNWAVAGMLAHALDEEAP